MAKNKLSIYLIKQDVPPEKITVEPDEDKGIMTLPVEGHDDYRLLVRTRGEHKPTWVESFFGSSVDGECLSVENVSLVLVIPVLLECNEIGDEEFDDGSSNGMEQNVRYFALTFGYGRALINRSSVEERFGLKCILNTVEPNTLRAVRFADVSGSAKRSSEQLPKAGGIDDFAFDADCNLLGQVTAKGEDGTFLSGMMTGRDSLSVTKEVNLENAEAFLRELYKVYRKDTYKQLFDWIDRIASVKDTELIDALWNEALHQISHFSEYADTNNNLWMAVPDVINWDDIEGFQIGNEKDPHGEPRLHNDILLGDVIRSFKKKPDSLEKLKSKKIKAISRIDGCILRTWSSSECLMGELNYNDKAYCICDGKWYEIQREYLERINEDIESIEEAKTSFIPFKENYRNSSDYKERDGKEINLENEGRYNYELTRQLNKDDNHFILMDRQLISYGGGASRIEFCDVLSDSGQRIHVKQYSGSSVMSHLFNQGLVSASIEKDGTDFAEKVDDKIQKVGEQGHLAQDEIDGFLVKNNPVREVVFGVIQKKDNRNLPFFSKVALSSVKKQLKRMGIETKFNWIARE